MAEIILCLGRGWDEDDDAARVWGVAGLLGEGSAAGRSLDKLPLAFRTLAKDLAGLAGACVVCGVGWSRETSGKKKGMGNEDEGRLCWRSLMMQDFRVPTPHA